MTRGDLARGARNLLLWVMLWIAGTGLAHAGTVVIGTGAVLDTGSGVLVLGCHDLEVAGLQRGHVTHAADIHILPGGSMGPGARSLSRDWSNAGAANVPGRVRWREDCAAGEAWILGSTEFAELHIASGIGRTIRFDAAAEQFVSQTLNLSGAEGAPLVLRSSVPGQRAGLTLAAQGVQTITHVDVADIDAGGGQTLAPGTPQAFASTDSGNNLNWFRGVMAAAPIPSLGGPGTWLLILLVLLHAGLAGRFSDLSPRSNP